MNDDKNWNNLEALSKKDIIEYFKKKNPYSDLSPTKKDINFYLWNKKSEENREKMEKHAEMNETRNRRAEELDETIRAFNAEKNVTKKIQLAEKAQKIQKELQAHHKNFSKLIKETKEIDKLLD